jgi:DNA-directed RNA polymerase subunit RPC12/RpoP
VTPDDFNKELLVIGGTNPAGQPFLRLVDGRREQTWVAGGLKLKYVGHTDEDGTEHGEEGLIVEQWRSPEFLAQTGRFPEARGLTTTTTTFACRSCGSSVPHRPGTEDMDVERECPACGSRRVSPAYEREEDLDLLPPLPAEGHYDYFLRMTDEQLQKRAGEFLDTVREVWAFQRLPLKEQNRLIDEQQEKVKLARAKAEKKRRDDLWGFDPDDLVLVTNSAGHQQYVKRKKEI